MTPDSRYSRAIEKTTGKPWLAVAEAVDAFGRVDVRFFGLAAVTDAPSESGNLDRCYGPSAVHAYRCSQARRRGELK